MKTDIDQKEEAFQPSVKIEIALSGIKDSKALDPRSPFYESVFYEIRERIIQN